VIRTQKRNELMQFLQERGIETLLHYPRILPNLPAYAYLRHKPTDFPVANHLEKEILSLPMYPEMTEEMISYVADTIQLFVKNNFVEAKYAGIAG